MQVGTYRLIVETARTDNADDDIGLQLTSTQVGTANAEVVINSTEHDNRFRETRILTVSSTGSGSGTVNLVYAVRPGFGAENYRLALLDAADSVPSPYFADCPPIEVLSPDTTQAFRLSDVSSANAEKWFYMQTATGNYDLNVESSRSDSTDSTIAYEFRFLNSVGGRFNDDGSDEFIVNGVGVSASHRSQIELSNSNGDQWAGFFRIRNLASAISNEITFSSVPQTAAAEQRSTTVETPVYSMPVDAPGIRLSISE